MSSVTPETMPAGQEKVAPVVENGGGNEHYGDAFPALGGSAAPMNGKPDPIGTKKPGTAPTQAAPTIRSSVITQVFYVPLEERRYKNLDTPFSADRTSQAQACQQISKSHNVQVETNLARDQSLTVVLTGKSTDVMKAKRDVINKLQTQAQMTLKIPREHYRFILGTKGKKLADLELETATKILIPRQEDTSDEIKIMGNKEGLDKAMHEIQLISDEQAKLAFERLKIPKIYHPFINGASNSKVKALQESTGARINIPPPSVMKDELTVAGDKDGVKKAVDEINRIYNEKRQKSQTVSVEVNKKQHKYVIGPKGSGLQEILSKFDTSVEVPPLDDPSTTITLRGESQQLGPALSAVYTKANSVVSFELPAPSWLHRFIIGKQGANIKKLMAEVPKVHIEFADGEDKISLEGPPEEVTVAQKQLEATIAELKRTMDFAEVSVNKKYHRNIIGKSGANRQRLMQETSTNIRIPNEEDPSDVIRIEGDPAGVKKVKAELMEMAKKMDNEKTRDILIEQRFHRQLIGQGGASIKEIRDQFNQVQISLPDSSTKSDIVTLRGPKKDVDQCYAHLEKMHKDLIVNNYLGEVKIFKDFHKNIIGKGGANIKKIRDETDTKIDLPSQGSSSDSISVTGKKENVNKAIAMIEKIQKELANIAEETVVIPHKLHNAVIGAKGRFIRAIMDECGGVIIRFPSENSASDNVVIRGPKDDVDNAKKQLLELVEDRKINSYTTEISAKPEFHKFLIGRGGVNIRKVRDKFGARVIFPAHGDEQPDVVTIIGKKDSVEQAKEHILEQIKELENVVEDTVEVPVKWHKNFVARRGEMLNQIAADYGGVSVSFPRVGAESTSVKLSGAKECVSGAKARILEIVDDLEAQVTIDCVILQKHHRAVMGAKGSRVQEITKDWNVHIKFPDRPKQDKPTSPTTEEAPAEAVTDAAAAGDAAAAPAETPAAAAAPETPTSDEPSPQDIIRISGKKENAEGAKAALIALVPITKEMEVAFEFHRNIIGKGGQDVRKLMDKYDVNIYIPPLAQASNIVKISGTENKVNDAMVGMEERIKELEGDKADRELRSFSLDVTVDPKYHPKIIGRGGAVIKKLRTDHQDVNIQMPNREAEDQETITITGYEASANSAKAAILKIVSDLESQTTISLEIDARVHNRIIGGRGAAIRKIMEEFKVDVRFPRSGDENKNLVEITGDEDACRDCEDELLNLEEEYLQDVIEREEMNQYTRPSRQDDKKQKNTPQKGFVVSGAPWDANSTEDFPSIGGGSAATSNGTSMSSVWGKR